MSDDNDGGRESIPLIGDCRRRRAPDDEKTEEVEPPIETLFHESRMFMKRVPRYIGQLTNGVPHGRGKSFCMSGELVYEGQWKNGVRHGYGTSFHRNGTPSYDGAWEDNKRHGYGTSFYPDGAPKYKGAWENNTRHGRGMSFFRESGKMESDGFWLNGEIDRTREFKKLYISGAVECESTGDGDGSYVSYFRDGTKHHLCVDQQKMHFNRPKATVVHHENGSVAYVSSQYRGVTHFPAKPGVWCMLLRGRYVGETDREDRPHGVGTIYYMGGDVYAGEFAGGVPHGRGALTSGELTKVGEFTDGQLADEYELYTKGGGVLLRRYTRQTSE